MAGVIEDLETRPAPHMSAAEAGLRYMSPGAPVILRIGCGAGFTYRTEDGRAVRDPDTLARIRALAIPPAWTSVRIAASAQAHVQATGRDQRGRKQYRYHPRWRETRDETKFARLLAFGLALGRIRARTRKDLGQRGLPRTKVLAALVHLLERTAVRIGNEEYARQNGSVGLTTMRDRHVTVRGRRITFAFVGKAGVKHRVELDHPLLARVVRRCQDLPGQELFQYLDDEGSTQRVTSDEVNAYLREISGVDFTAKDFRTWAGTVMALAAFRALGAPAVETDAKKVVVQAVTAVASVLGNTSAVCRASYIHPAVVSSYLDGSLAAHLAVPARRRRGTYTDDERVVLDLLATHTSERLTRHRRRARAA